MTYRASFWLYDSQNPKIYELFKSFAYQLKDAGCTRIGAKAIMERMRWEAHLSMVKEPGQPLRKLNNNFTRDLALKLVHENPAFAEMFEFRSKNDKL